MVISACLIREEKVKLDSTHLFLLYSVDTSREHILTTSLVDSGAKGIAFIDQTFIRKYKLTL